MPAAWAKNLVPNPFPLSLLFHQCSVGYTRHWCSRQGDPNALPWAMIVSCEMRWWTVLWNAPLASHLKTTHKSQHTYGPWTYYLHPEKFLSLATTTLWLQICVPWRTFPKRFFRSQSVCFWWARDNATTLAAALTISPWWQKHSCLQHTETFSGMWNCLRSVTCTLLFLSKCCHWWLST